MARLNSCSPLTIRHHGKEYHLANLPGLKECGLASIKRLPFSIRILLENALRLLGNGVVREEDVYNMANWQPSYAKPVEFPFYPTRVLMQDFTGVPAVVDLAAMRDAMLAIGRDPAAINPQVPVDLIIDHSVQVDYFGRSDALEKNVACEYQRNSERYAFLKWAQRSFANFRVVPPNSGICHQVNLEYLAGVCRTIEQQGQTWLVPDTFVGTDSHSTMVNGIGVLGWGVGGIEAEAVMLGQPYFMSIPEVIGVNLTGKLPERATATDLVLTLTELLRAQNVVEKFVEFTGPGIAELSAADRATIGNMAPEYGATVGFFPVDQRTLEYLIATGRAEQADLVEAATRASNLFWEGQDTPEYTILLDFDLGSVVPSVAGPARPYDRIPLEYTAAQFQELMGCHYERDVGLNEVSTFHDESGNLTHRAPSCKPRPQESTELKLNNEQIFLADGSIVIAAITSCTNTSNPDVLIGAGLLAKKAGERGLHVPAHVKTSFAPGSRVVTDYLQRANLMQYLEQLGFHLAGYGCTTCIGNSGPLPEEIEKHIITHNLTVASVLSGNRNFEARIHQRVKANYLASPPLVIAFALAGRIDINLTEEPLGHDAEGQPVFLDEIWPLEEEIEAVKAAALSPDQFKQQYRHIFAGDEFWQKLPCAENPAFQWEDQSTYIRKPPYFENFSLSPPKPIDIKNARVLGLYGDTVTTDHISPAGAIPVEYPAGQHLLGLGVEQADFNSYGSRRGNHEVMMRGTFGNVRLKNLLASPKEGAYTVKFPESAPMYIYDAACRYAEKRVPLVVLAGKEYGTGSSRDWAAKGTQLLGVKAVLARSFERIHRANLIGMGVLPLVFQDGESWESLGLNGAEQFSITGLTDLAPRKTVEVTAVTDTGASKSFQATVRLDTDIEVKYYLHGGVLHYVLRSLAGEAG